MRRTIFSRRTVIEGHIDQPRQQLFTRCGRALEGLRFTQVHHVLHGFEGGLGANRHRNETNGWRHDGLPWAQS